MSRFVSHVNFMARNPQILLVGFVVLRPSQQIWSCLIFNCFQYVGKIAMKWKKMGHVVIDGLVCTQCHPSFVVTIRNLYSIKK